MSSIHWRVSYYLKTSNVPFLLSPQFLLSLMMTFACLFVFNLFNDSAFSQIPTSVLSDDALHICTNPYLQADLSHQLMIVLASLVSKVHLLFTIIAILPGRLILPKGNSQCLVMQLVSINNAQFTAHFS